MKITTRPLIDGGSIGKPNRLVIVADMLSNGSLSYIVNMHSEDGNEAFSMSGVALSSRAGYNVFWIEIDSDPYNFISIEINEMYGVRSITDTMLVVSGEILA